MAVITIGKDNKMLKLSINLSAATVAFLVILVLL